MASGSSMLLFGKWNEDDHVNQALDIEQDDHVVPPVQPLRKRRNPIDPDAEVVALSPTTLMAKNRFVCEVCRKGFPREQNLQLHKRGHNLPWKLKQRTTNVKVNRKVYLCPEPSCIHHSPSHALRDLTGIKKHYSRKHITERNYKCLKCAKMYAVQSDLKAHLKICGKKEYQCHCGTLFSRRDNFLAHRSFCEALAKEAGIKHPPTIRDMGVNSFKISGNNNNQPKQMRISLPQLGYQAPSIHNLNRTIPTIDVGVSQFGRATHNSLMIRPSMNLNINKPLPTFFVPTSGRLNQQIYQQKVDTSIFTNFMKSDRNYGSGEGSSLFTSGGIRSDGWTPLYLSEQQPPPNTFSNMGFQQYNGVTFTRDFLGVGGEIGHINNNGPQCTFGGGSIQ
ncbi:hypothetical protein L6452_18443 [Arctium lappa]|uniref:Uncharacterized protein n=1 Tax=Arctium lappa TaxID=4217 RepID=A0ACB9C6H7_ARCLA|nr:hypothetical protein L6452_18443 [Arctium lappa]